MVGESWNIFTKRVLFEKHISSIMYKNPGGHDPLSADVMSRSRSTSFNYKLYLSTCT